MQPPHSQSRSARRDATRRETASLLYFPSRDSRDVSSVWRAWPSVCMCIRAHAWHTRCNGEESRRVRTRRKTVSARKRGTAGKERREERTCMFLRRAVLARKCISTDGRTSRADRSVPILVRLSTSLSLRNRTKPVSRHFGANQWRTPARLFYLSLSLSFSLSLGFITVFPSASD